MHLPKEKMHGSLYAYAASAFLLMLLVFFYKCNLRLVNGFEVQGIVTSLKNISYFRAYLTAVEFEKPIDTVGTKHFIQ